MQSVKFFFDVQTGDGAFGFSILQAGVSGESKRMTLLYLRDGEGWVKSCVIAPAETLREVIF
jgi:hypothetical protein